VRRDTRARFAICATVTADQPNSLTADAAAPNNRARCISEVCSRAEDFTALPRRALGFAVAARVTRAVVERLAGIATPRGTSENRPKTIARFKGHDATHESYAAPRVTNRQKTIARFKGHDAVQESYAASRVTTPGSFGLPDARCYVHEALRLPDTRLSANSTARIAAENLTRDAGRKPRGCCG
jgi:hypothetical protein